MSRQAIKEDLREKHVRYERASKEKKHTVINEIHYHPMFEFC